MKCKICGSLAINHNLHGRDGSEPELCDVCFWRYGKISKDLVCPNKKCNSTKTWSSNYHDLHGCDDCGVQWGSFK